MLTQIIEKTNDPEFYSNYDLSLKKLIWKYDEDIAILELTLLVKDVELDSQEHWRIRATDVLDYKGLHNNVLLPYVKITHLNKHPLLDDYQIDSMICALKGILNDPHLIYFELRKILETVTGGFIHNQELLSNLLYMNKNQHINLILQLNKNIYTSFNRYFNKDDLTLKVLEQYSNEQKGYLNHPKASLLIFGNEEISSIDYNNGQPYIIAENFLSEIVKL